MNQNIRKLTVESTKRSMKAGCSVRYRNEIATGIGNRNEK